MMSERVGGITPRYIVADERLVECYRAAAEGFVESAQSLATDEEFDVEMTGYIVEPNPAASVIGSESSHSSLQIYASDDPSGNYVLALFSDSADKLNETISEVNQPAQAGERVSA